MSTLASASSNCIRQTQPLIKEGAPHHQYKSVIAPDEFLSRGWTGRLTIGHNVWQLPCCLHRRVSCMMGRKGTQFPGV
jgi:hypothetical protein